MTATPPFDAASYAPRHFKWRWQERVGVVTLDRPERKNPLTFDSYAELRDLFRALDCCARGPRARHHGAGGNFCSGGDVHEIIGPLTQHGRRGTARVHADDGRCGEGHARLPAAHRRRG